MLEVWHEGPDDWVGGEKEWKVFAARWAGSRRVLCSCWLCQGCPWERTPQQMRADIDWHDQLDEWTGADRGPDLEYFDTHAWEWEF
jgi:hypothetical protein